MTTAEHQKLTYVYESIQHDKHPDWIDSDASYIGMLNSWMGIIMRAIEEEALTK